jgi:hypothetical protein
MEEQIALLEKGTHKPEMKEELIGDMRSAMGQKESQMKEGFMMQCKPSSSRMITEAGSAKFTACVLASDSPKAIISCNTKE